MLLYRTYYLILSWHTCCDMGLLVLVIFTDVNMIYDYNVKIVMITVEMNVYG